jgi:hypothetical protein
MSIKSHNTSNGAKKFSKNSTVAAIVLAVSFVFGLAGPIAALAAGPGAVNLAAAGNFVILSKTGISTTGSTAIVGDIGVSPAAASYITGFAPTLPAASAFSTSALITGKVYAPGYADPTPSNLTTAVLDMQTAYTDAAGRAPNVTELGAGNIGGLTLAPGVYKWGTGVIIPTDVTLSGSANDVWIFQIAQTLTVSSGVKIILSGGAQAGNIFWVVAGQTTVGTTASFNGNILDQTAVVLNTGASLKGRALAQTAVTLDSNSVIIPSAVVITPTPPPAGGLTPASTSTPGSTPLSTGSGSSAASSSLPSNNGGESHGSPVPPTATLIIPTANSTLPTASAFGQQVRTIAISLGKGSRDNNVTILQQFLISQNKGPAAAVLAKVGATGYFGALTRAALAEFQGSVGISPAWGNFGPITRSYLNANY